MAYKKKTDQPEELRILIAAFNAIPSDRDFSKTKDVAAEAFLQEIELLISRYQREWRDAVGKRDVGKVGEIDQRTASLAAKLITPDIQAAIRFPDVMSARMEIERLIIERRVLVDIVNAYWNHGPGQDFHLRDEAKKFPYRFRENGTVTPSSRILEIFGEIPPERIRICQICQTIFWAKKANAWTCSPACATKLGNKKRLAASKKSKQNQYAQDSEDSYTTI